MTRSAVPRRPAAGASDDVVGTVTVPRRPGPLHRPGAEARPNDDLDDFIDELFGETTTERPGLFDVVLIAIGAALMLWSILGGAGAGWLVIGIFAALLGLALPARGVVRTARRRRSARAASRERASGYPLDVTHRATTALIDAYQGLVDTASRSRVPLAHQALEAGHLAVVEVATLLDGAPPVTEREVAYVERRTSTIREAADALRRAGRAAHPRSAGAADPSADDQRRRADAVTAAREELEAAGGLSSVQQLETVRDLLRREADDVGTRA